MKNINKDVYSQVADTNAQGVKLLFAVYQVLKSHEDKLPEPVKEQLVMVEKYLKE